MLLIAGFTVLMINSEKEHQRLKMFELLNSILSTPRHKENDNLVYRGCFCHSRVFKSWILGFSIVILVSFFK